MNSRNGFFDVVMPFVTNNSKVIFLPFLILFLIKEKRKAIPIFGVLFFSVLLADWTTNVIKEFVGRQRPCNAFQNVHLLVGCSKSFSLPSGHASNGIAAAVSFLLMTRNPLKYLFLFLGALVAISRVFVGVHYPIDVIAGGAVGASTAIIVTYLFQLSEKRYRKKPYITVLYASLLVLSIFRIYYIFYGHLDLSPDEAHYWEWSRRPDLSYYSKGPMIAYLISLSTLVFGDNVFGVRIFAVLFSVLSSLVLYRLGKEMHNELVGTASALLLQIIPLFSAYGIIFTIDSPFVFFWILSLYLFWKAVGGNITHDKKIHYPESDTVIPAPCLQEGRKAGIHSEANMDARLRTSGMTEIRWWIFLGISVGFGLLTKYTMVFFHLCAFLFIISSVRNRNLLKSAMPYVAFTISILIFTPVVIWNAQHGWVTFRHTAGQAHIADGLSISAARLAEFVGSQFGVVSPILFAMIMIALWKIRNGGEITKEGEGALQRDEPSGLRGKFLFWFSMPVIFFFTLKSIQGKVQANWAMMGYITGLIAFSKVFMDGWDKRGISFKAVIIWGFSLSLLITAVGLYPSKFHLPLKLDPSARLRGWDELGTRVNEIYEGTADKNNVFIFSDSYQVSSELAFYMPGHPVTYCVNLGRRMNQYDLWPQFGNLKHYEGIFVTIGDREFPEGLKEAFRGCEKSLYKVYEREKVLRQYSIFLCRDFQGMEGEAESSAPRLSY